MLIFNVYFRVYNIILGFIILIPWVCDKYFLNMKINHGQAWSVMVKHGQAWTIMVNIGQTWSTMIIYYQPLSNATL